MKARLMMNEQNVILIVDDVPTQQSLLADYLEAFGF